MAIVKVKARGKGMPQEAPAPRFFLQADLTGVLWPDTIRDRHAISLKERKRQDRVQRQ